jgi:predicted AAA+ superfamily ATPase
VVRKRAASVYRRPIFDRLLERAHEERRFLQVLAGPRQVGKTTLARQVMDAVGVPAHFASADDPALRDRGWLETQWQLGRARARDGGRAGALLVLDEIQKVPDWSELVKTLWDEDTAAGLPLRVMLLGSAPLLMQRGLSESLAGRFEVVRVSHWSLGEMREAFGWDLDRYLFFGGYPGAAGLAPDEDRWRAYVLDALVETSLARDILLLARVDKPALLRRLFRLACERSGDVVSYTRMLELLPGVGNTVTLAHYLDLLAGAGLVAGLSKYVPADVLRQRGSSPKLLALNTALIAATSGASFAEARTDADLRGRLVEAAIGAHVAGAVPLAAQLSYWRDGRAEVDFVLPLPGRRGGVVAVEVASGRQRDVVSGVGAFRRLVAEARPLLVGGRGVDVDEFLSRDPGEWLSAAA